MKTLSIVKYVFAAIGVAMLLGAFLLYRSTSSFLAEASTAQGTVMELLPMRSDDSTTYKPVVQFTTEKGEAIEFASSSSSNPPSYEVGEIVAVFYRADKPHEAKINGFFSLWGGAVIVGCIGAVFFSIGGGILLVMALKDRSDSHLKTHGTPIETDFQSVELNTSLEVNNRHPFRIVTQWLNPATAELHIFHSNNLWFDPTNFIKNKRITVLIDASNPKKYYMDTAFLPKVAG
jgi:hypothetical protein